MGKVLHVTLANALDTAWAQKNLTGADLWLGYDIYFVAGIPGVGSGNNTLDFGWFGDAVISARQGAFLYDDGAAIKIWTDQSNNGPFATVTTGVWYHVDQRYAPGTPIGVGLFVANADQSETSTANVANAIDHVGFGDAGAFGWESGYELYIRNITVGATRGASGVWNGDITTGLAAFDSTHVGAGQTLEVIDDPTPPDAVQPQGVSVAFGSDALDATPTYTRIDDPAGINVVNGWQTKRGRTYMTDRTEAGTAQADFIDTNGETDPTNSTGPFYPMDPNCPFTISLYHPIDEDWHTIYTGLVQNMPQTLDLSENFIRGSLNAADLFSLLAIAEIPPGLDFDDTALGTNTANAIGDTTYAAADVQDRIKAILADAAIPAGLTNIFTGNVNVQFTTYPPGTQVLAALQDAADAEFPGVANLYIDKFGIVTFHGRKARFDPTNPDYGISTWNVGDTAAVLANPTWALISGLEFDRDVAKVINAARAAPDGILDADIPGQLVVDSGSITQYGDRIYTAENLLTLEGKDDALDANDETKLFSTYYATNFHDAQNQIQRLTVQGVPVGAPYAEATWDILCGVEIGDVVNVTTTHPGGGGFSAAPYFVEGISYTATNLGGAVFQDVQMVLELSPQAYFTSDPGFL